MLNQSYKISLGAISCGIAMFSTSATALSQNCVSNNCITLGFTMNEAYCDGNIIRCPFDTSKVYCKEKKPLSAGDILFSDKTTSNEMVSGKIAIGIVVDPVKRYAIALKCSSLQWANQNYYSIQKDIPNLANVSGEKAASDFNGKANTKIIVNASTSLYPAANYCYKYSTSGTKAGDWYLPAGGQIKTLCQNKKEVNTGLAKTANPTLEESFNEDEYLTSNEGDYASSGYTTMVYGRLGSSSCCLTTVNKYWAVGPGHACPFIDF